MPGLETLAFYAVVLLGIVLVVVTIVVLAKESGRRGERSKALEAGRELTKKAMDAVASRRAARRERRRLWAQRHGDSADDNVSD